MSEVITFECIPCDDRAYVVGDIVEIFLIARCKVIIGRIDKITTADVVIDCSEKYSSKYEKFSISDISTIDIYGGFE